MNCQRWILGIRWFHFVPNASVTSQTGEEGYEKMAFFDKSHFISKTVQEQDTAIVTMEDEYEFQ